MSDFETITLIIALAALAGYLNQVVLKLPVTIGLMAVSLILSGGVVLMGNAGWIDAGRIRASLAHIDFQDAVLHWMLPFLLFASALHVDFADLRRHGAVVGLLATLGVLIGTGVTGSAFWLGLHWMGLDIPIIYALLFGALISPTDPIASLGIIKKIGAPKSIEAKIAGESLLNDGMGVTLFLLLAGIAAGGPYTGMGGFSGALLTAIVGGVLVGGVLGLAGYQLLKTVDQYEVEILITLALATSAYALAERLHVSAPIAVVVAGLFAGAWAKHARRLDDAGLLHTRQQLSHFWELSDEILNAVLFMLIGLELLILQVHLDYWWIAMVAVVSVLLGRWVSVVIPIQLVGLRQPVERGVIPILTWGGLRGGISIALALSLPPGPERELILAATYITVLFSILGQGLTFGWVVRHYTRDGGKLTI